MNIRMLCVLCRWLLFKMPPFLLSYERKEMALLATAERGLRIMKDRDADEGLLLAILFGHKVVVLQDKDHERL